jgi:hypothetical protein
MKFSVASLFTLSLVFPATSRKLQQTPCEDDPVTRFFVNETGKEEPCVWLAARMEKFSYLCDTEVGDICPETCRKCSDDYFCTDTTLYFDVQGTPRNCLWLSLRNNFIASECSAGSNAALACPETCGICETQDDPGYGPLQLTNDETTGLPLLALPQGFRYLSFGWTGQIMDDGTPTPTDHDGKGRKEMSH